MVGRILIHLEGSAGGKQQPTLQEAMDDFLEEPKQAAGDRRIKWNVNPCNGRQQAYDDFLTAVQQGGDTLNILLVDSEDPPGDRAAWLHLRDRAGDPMPLLTKDLADQCHLMVRCMESWFLADKQRVRKWYADGQRFHENRLPQNPQVEFISKEDVLEGLAAATRDTKKGPYHKTRHGPALLMAIDPAKVRHAAPHCQCLFDFLLTKINE